MLLIPISYKINFIIINPPFLLELKFFSRKTMRIQNNYNIDNKIISFEILITFEELEH